MSRYLPVDSFNTGTIAAGASVDFNRSFGANNLNIVKIKVTPSGATTGYKVQVFKDVLRTKELLATKDQVVTPFYAPTSRSGGEMLEGFVAPYEDLDGTGQLHLYITNHDTVGRNYDIEITCEAPALVGTGGAQTFEGTEPRLIFKETDGGTDEKIWDIAAIGETLLVRTRTDADGAGATLLSFTGRTGTAVTYALFGTDVAINPTKKLWFDGVGNTYIHEAGADQLHLVAGATSYGFTTGGFMLPPTKALWFDSGGDTYIQEAVADILTVVAGGVASAQFITTGVSIAPTNKLYLDGGGDTYITEVSANLMRFVVGGVVAADFYNSGIAIGPTNKIYLDGGVDTYITESSANNIQLHAGGSLSASLNSTALAIPATNRLYLDGGGNTYISETTADTLGFTIGGNLSVVTNGSDFQFKSGTNLGWSSSATDASVGSDTKIARLAAGIAGMKNGSAANDWRVHGDASKYASLQHDGSHGFVGSSSGNLFITAAANVMLIPASNITLIQNGAAAQELRIYGDATKYVTLYHNGSDAALSVSSGLLYLNSASHAVYIQNGTNAQELRVYGTTTGPKYLAEGHDATQGYIDSTNDLAIRSAGATYWRFVYGAGFQPETDNAYPLGGASNRASNIFSVIGTFGTTPATAGLIRVPTPVSTEATIQTPLSQEFCGVSKTAIPDGITSSLFDVNIDTDGKTSGIHVMYSVTVDTGSEIQVETGVVSFAMYNNGGTQGSATPVKFGNVQQLSTGTLTVTFSTSDSGSDTRIVRVNIASSLSQASKITYKIVNNSAGAITLL